MKLRSATCALLALAVALVLLAAPAAPAAVLEGFDASFYGPPAPGSPPGALGPLELEAGTHPYAMKTYFALESVKEGVREYPAEALKDLTLAQVEGFAGIPSAVPRCEFTDFLVGSANEVGNATACPNNSVLGEVEVTVGTPEGSGSEYAPLYNLPPAPGSVARLGFDVKGVRVTIDVGLSEAPPYRVVARLRNISNVLVVFDSETTLWGDPADERHDPLRGSCLKVDGSSAGDCEAVIPHVPFLIAPRACRGPLATLWAADSWTRPGAFDEGSALSHDEFGDPLGFGGCGSLPFSPTISSQPSSRAAVSPSGLDFHLDVSDPGLANSEGTAASDIERTVVTLPAGMTINPSQAEGLGVCTEAQLAAESPYSAPGEGPTYTPPGAGCPEASKIGTIEVETPLLPEALLKGALYVAEPYRNPFGSLIAVYVVIKDPELGIVVKQPLRVEPDPVTGRLVTTAENMPQLPFSHFRLHFREGGRAPLITPPGCGSFDTTAMLYPYSGGSPFESSSTFQIVSGPNNSGCPQGAAPFYPGFEAGTLNNAAGAYSPFNMRLTRSDGEQDMGKFSFVLPPGVVPKLAGIPYCSDAAIAGARGRQGEHGGQEEARCPELPGRLPDRHDARRRGSRLPAHLRARQALPSRPLPRRPDLRGGDRPRCGRPLRRGHDRRPRGAAAQPGHPRRRSRRLGV